MSVVTCPVCGKEWSALPHLPAGERRCPDCRGAGRRPAAEWAAIAAAALVFVALAAVLWASLR
jgi:hypothetical protein